MSLGMFLMVARNYFKIISKIDAFYMVNVTSVLYPVVCNNIAAKNATFCPVENIVQTNDSKSIFIKKALKLIIYPNPDVDIAI